MVRSNLCIAAGVGVAAAFLLIGGPSVGVSIAGPGGSHGAHSDRHGGSGSPGGSDWSDANIAKGPKKSSSDGPSSKVGSQPGNDYSPDPSGQFNAPKVTFGDGRTPGIQDHDPEPRWGGSAPEPAPPPPPPPPPIITPAPPRTDRVHDPRVIQQLVVAPTSALHDPFFGLAGLLLIPAAGAVLGYRQARAAQGADKLRRT